MFPGKSGYTSMAKTVSCLKEMIGAIVEKHKATFTPGMNRDFIDVYLDKIAKTSDPNSSFYGSVGG